MELFMKSLKSHFSLTVALFTIIFTLQVFFIIDRVISSYENNLNKNYSLVVVSLSTLKEAQVKDKIANVKSLETLSVDSVINKLKDQLNKTDLGLLRATLPKFYKIHLSKFPSPTEIKAIERNLLKIKDVTSVESFSKSHDQVYKLMVIFKGTSYALAIIVITVSLLLIFREMRIWQYEHHERMLIMSYFGAPVWMRSAILFKFSFVDSILSTLLVIGTFYFIEQQPEIITLLKSLNVDIELFDLAKDSLFIASTSFGIAFSLAAFVIISQKKEYR